MSSPQRYSKGVTNVASGTTLGQCIVPDPTTVNSLVLDFNKFTPGDWVITRIHNGTTAGAENLTDAVGGVLAFYPANADDDSTFFQWKGDENRTTATESFLTTSGKKLWFKARFKVSDTGDSDFIIGLQSADTTPTTSPVDAIWFKSDDGDDYLDFGMYSSSVATLADANVSTLVDNTYVTVGFYYDGVDKVEYFVNDSKEGETTATLPAGEMTISFGVQNGSAASRTMSVDYIVVVEER